MFKKLNYLLTKNSFKQVGLFTITGALTKIISFAALPFFVNTLSEGDIGILNIFSSSIVFLTPIISMGALYSLSVEYYKQSKKDYAVLFSTSLIIPVLLSLILVPLFFFITPFLSSTFNFQNNFFWLIPVCLLLNFFFEAFIIILRMDNNLRLFSTISVLKIFVEIAVSILLIYFVSKTWYSRALGYLAAGAVVTIVFMLYTLRKGLLIKSISTKILAKELTFGISGILLQTAVFFIGTSDKFFVMAYFGKDQAGLYAVAATFATIQYIVCTSLLQYLQPIVFKKYAVGEKWSSVKKLYGKYAVGMFGTAILLSIFTIVVYQFLLKDSYQHHIHYFFILCASSFLWSITNIFLQYIIFKKSKTIISQLAIISIIISFSVNSLAVHYFDIIWLCYAQILINLLVLTVTLLFNQKLKYFQ